MYEEPESTTGGNRAGIDRWEHVVTRLMLVIRMRFMRQLSQYGLTMPQFFVLKAISRSEQERAMRELARETHQVSATVTGIVDRLVRDGLVERHRDSEDRRVVLVCLTPAGRELVERVSDTNRATIEGWLSRVGREKTGRLLDLLSLLLTTIEEGPSQPGSQGLESLDSD